jgi:RNA polymerase sigma-70 factor, ECF subfamily
MHLPPDDPKEENIRAACSSGDYGRATTAALRAYGGEIFGLLVALHRQEDAADDAFSLFTERLWQALPAFGWRCSLRTWLYCLARTASADFHRNAGRRREVPLSTNAFDELRAEVRTATLSMLRTARRTELELLRDELPPEDRMLLILRVDRDLSWRDVALVMSGAAEASAPSVPEEGDRALAQETARLRKRFQLVKERLRETARSRGLI